LHGLLQVLEPARHVAVVALVNESEDEALTGGQKFRAAWMCARVVCPSEFNAGNDLRSRKNVVGLMRHVSVSKLGDTMPIFWPNNNPWIRS